MNAESKILTSVLALTKNGQARLEDIKRKAKTIDQLTRSVLQRYFEKGYFKFEEDYVIVGKKNRVQLAIHAIQLGADLERICTLISWDEFEDISEAAFQASRFSTKKHFRFKWFNRRWEIDILAFKNPFIVSVDCKQWRHGWRGSSITNMVESQIERTEALTAASVLLRKKMGITKWKRAVFVPAILSLMPSTPRFYRKTPIVPVLKIRDFANGVVAHTSVLNHFSREFGDSMEE